MTVFFIIPRKKTSTIASFVYIANSPTVHVNGYSFRLSCESLQRKPFLIAKKEKFLIPLQNRFNPKQLEKLRDRPQFQNGIKVCPWYINKKRAKNFRPESFIRSLSHKWHLLRQCEVEALTFLNLFLFARVH